EGVLVFPAGFADRIQSVRQAVVARQSSDAALLPELVLLNNSANEKSQIAQLRVEQVLRRWRTAVTEQNLVASDVPKAATQPFELQPRDVALVGQRHAVLWSKVLPFFVFIWALTGAFYPAVDLCAGEKERGTLETLLTSPALRREIVWGKLLTVMSFSIATALLNLASLGVTGKFVIDQLSAAGALGDRFPIDMPSLAAVGWLVAALAPIAALFSALCLACAAQARSTKEGQYYLMPLMLISTPLMLLPISPGVELTPGNSVIPLTGVVLLLRAVIEGQHEHAVLYLAPVAATTLACVLLAIRWAEEQFNRESVLFRESERLELRRWLIHVVRDRGETPSFAQSMLCIATILVVQFFVSVALSTQAAGPMSFAILAKTLVISQLACVFAPAALMTIMLTRNPRRTLLVERSPAPATLLGALLLAVALHPAAVYLTEAIARLYPPPAQALADFEEMGAALAGAPNIWIALGLLALLPAICEELALRGFVLSGLRHLGHKWWAIAISAVAFGAVHTILQQKVTATVAGIVLGYLAVQTSSLWPCIVFHATHNGLMILAPKWGASSGEGDGLLARLFGGIEPLAYRPATAALGGVMAAGILWGFHQLAYRRTPEEQLEEARRRQDLPLVGACQAADR
ncbi:MAG TPA: ABC transporter permease subunit/CPBP intramembrane protease, partial [Lacipirellulaceae bacterium]|nr:ABC transporter permease subunit/CPBP intramembrane protease [Lacipirellulaceae bacterium]